MSRGAQLVSESIVNSADHTPGARLQDRRNTPVINNLQSNVSVKLDEIIENLAKDNATKAKNCTNQDNESASNFKNKYLVVSVPNADDKASDSKKITYYMVNTHSEESISNVENSLLRKALTEKTIPPVTYSVLENVDSSSNSASDSQYVANMFAHMLSNVQLRKYCNSDVSLAVDTANKPSLVHASNAANLKPLVTNTNAANKPSVRCTANTENNSSVSRITNAANKPSKIHIVNAGRKPRGRYKGPNYRPLARRTYEGPKSKPLLQGYKSDVANITLEKCNKSNAANVLPFPNVSIDLTDPNSKESNKLHDNILESRSDLLDNINLPVMGRTSPNVDINSVPLENVTSTKYIIPVNSNHNMPHLCIIPEPAWLKNKK